MAKPVLFVLNGPNLELLGEREPEIYGTTTLADIEAMCRAEAGAAGLELRFHQTNAEHEMIGWLHNAADGGIPVVLNPGAWSHYSIAVRDAAAMLTAPLVEVHISNIHTREEFRHHSVISAVATGVIAGLGVGGYAAALRWIVEQAAGPVRPA